MANQNQNLTTQQSFDLTRGLAELEEFKADKGEDITGLEVVDQTDIKLPKIKIAQLTSKEVSDGIAKPGQFVNTVTGKTYDQLPVTLLMLGKSRVKWKQPFKRGEEPLCRSFDGKVRYDGKKLCANCPDQDWNKALAEGKSKPDCNMSYVWLGLTLDDSPMPFRLIASGKSVSPTKNFINEIFPRRYPTYVYNVMLSTEKESNESGTFFVLRYDIIGVAQSKEEALQRKDLAEGLKEVFNKAIEIDTTTIEYEDEVIMATDEGNAEPSHGQLF